MSSGTALTPVVTSSLLIPKLVDRAGPEAALRFLEFFTVHIRNPNTRAAYGHAAGVFLHWCEERGSAELRQVQPIHVAAYVEQLGRERSRLPSSNTLLVCGCSLIGSSPAR